MNKLEQFGFIEPKIEEQDYKFAAKTKLTGQKLTDGHWLKYVPDGEIQAKKIETYNCTAFGTTNCLEMLFKVLGFNRNFSDRFLGIIANTKPPEGNDPKVVIDVARKKGLAREEVLPFNDSINSWEEYYSPKPPTEDLLAEGRIFLDSYGLGYEWVADDPKSIMEALKFSPLGVSVKSWYEENGLYYHPETQPYSHWTTLVGFKIPEE